MELTLTETTPQGMTYRQQLAAINSLSYSTILTAHSCPRRFLLEKAGAALAAEDDDNPDFLFGHAVAAGVQSYIAFGSEEQALLDCFLAWKGNLLTVKEKSKKSIWFALQATRAFIAMKEELIGDWQVAVLPATADGKPARPAVELAFCLDLENGYQYLGHIDLVLMRTDKDGKIQLMVLELKTTSFTTVHEAIYKNSAQALGYSVMLETLAAAIGADSVNYSVLYLVYKTGAMQFETFPFLKSKTQRVTWIHQILMDCQLIQFYRDSNYYPMHGESCYSFFRACEFFGTCDLQMLQKRAIAGLIIADTNAKDISGIDFYLSLKDILETQQLVGG